MGKLWRFLSVSIVIAVCLGLMLVPGVPPANKVALAAGNVTIAVVPSTTTVVPNGTFNVSVVIDNPDGNEIYGAQARLDFDSSYFNVTNITNGPILTELVISEWNNSAGSIDHDCNMPTPPGNATNATSILVCNISCQAHAKEGASTIDFVYQGAPPFRNTMVVDGFEDYLEGGNMSLMHSGTVKIGTHTLTVNVTPLGKGNVTINAVTPPSYPNITTWYLDEVVNLTAVESVPNWTFDHWSGTDNNTINPTTVTMDSNQSVVAHFARYNLTVTTNATRGTVTLPGVGTFRYPEGESVPLVAASHPGYGFANWTGGVGTIGDVNASSTFINMTGDYSIYANFVVVITATLEGHVSLTGLPATNVTVRFFDPGTQNETMKEYTSTDSNGNFTIGNLTPGSYDVAVKGQTSLSNLESGVSFTAGNTTPCDFGVLLEGDATGDDYVYAADFGILSGAWKSWPGQPNWDARADFSRDDYIFAADFGVLSGDWKKWGNCYGWSGNWT